MAFFGKKKTNEPSDNPPDIGAGNGNLNSDGGDGGESGSNGDFSPQPEKARKWFQHARTAADSSNFEYAITCFANGLKFDPEDMKAHQDMYDAAIRFLSNGGKAASGRDIRAIEGPHAVDKFAAAEFAWMRSIMNASLGVKLIQATVNAEQYEFGRWFSPKLFNLLRQQKKPSKSDFVITMRACGEVGAWECAIAAGETAVSLDPTDGNLAAEIKNLSAQRAMDQGGYDEAGEEGGFRKFVRDEDKQRELLEEESLSGAGSSDERVIARAKTAYEENHSLPENIQRYAQLVKKSNTTEALEEAYAIYTKGFEDTKEYRFRMAAGDIRIAQKQAKVKELEQKCQSSPDDLQLKDQLKDARTALLDLKGSEYAEREDRYPTDRSIKFQRGLIEFAREKYEDAMACFQAAKDEPKLRVRSGHLLGQCFAAENWHQEAVGEYYEALENIDATQKDRELDIRYDLMVSLIARAKDESSVDFAKDALDICSGIARKNITYKDIRTKRKEIDKLTRELNEG